MKTKFIPLLLAGIATLSLSGCIIAVDKDGYSHEWSSSSWENRENRNRSHLANLMPGMAIEEVKSTMGVADFNEAYEKQGGMVQVLYYRTQRAHGDGKTTKDECTPLVFKGGKLVGWGDKAYAMM